MSLEDLRNKVTELKIQIKNKSSTLLFQELKKVFDKYPELKKVSWKQYTCYFNDGDELYFSVHNYYDSLDINGQDIWDYEDKDSWEIPAAKELSEVLTQIDEDTYMMMYGDHAEITIHRDCSVKVAEYTNHD